MPSENLNACARASIISRSSINGTASYLHLSHVGILNYAEIRIENNNEEHIMRNIASDLCRIALLCVLAATVMTT